MLAEAIFAAMLRLTCPADEPASECEPWRAQVAFAVAQASEEATCTAEWSELDCEPLYKGPPDELAAVLVEVAMHESGLRKRIQAGNCRLDECDGIKSRKTGKWTGRHLARSMWQLHETPYIPGVDGLVPHETWLASTGTGHLAIVTAARTASRLLIRSPKAFGLDKLLSRGERGRAARRLLDNIRVARKARSEVDA